MSSLGYFAFPPPEPGKLAQDAAEDRKPESQGPSQSRVTAEERAREEQRKAQEARRKRRHEMEQEQALQGEMVYVRMGFSIRDRHGRVDKTRTDFVRAEIRRRDELARLIKQWEAYEARWRAILSSDGPLAFVDIPWPAYNPPSSVTELHPETVVRFFLQSLQLPGNNVSEADRLRAALLRWHPDKMSGIFARVMDTDVQNVREGVNLVFRALHGRFHHVKDNTGTKP